MIPYKDDNPTSTFPIFTVSIIAINVIVFMFELVSDANKIVFAFGAIPEALMTFQSIQPIHPVFTIFTAMFLHGGFLHIAGNMLYLWIFGDNIEDRLGHFRFLIFYLMGGFVAAYAHAITETGSRVPMIGASGAVSAVLGAYILLYPKAKVYTLIFLGFFIQVVRLPSLIVIGFWAIIQIVSGLIDKGILGQGGIAWFAHVGGFLFGVLAIKVLAPKRRKGIVWS